MRAEKVCLFVLVDVAFNHLAHLPLPRCDCSHEFHRLLFWRVGGALSAGAQEVVAECVSFRHTVLEWQRAPQLAHR